ncbi:hypothetical protein [Pseudomonas saxonica]|uniref:Uncharacterized protein n=1 Tax=Pseudomonas saxonica TaxID=2600598 RepID=A0A5C5Q4H9_9PSED|nr:hypothetical protein [Pseudomonas saxonica]TWS00050.1 hypothetical protein FJD37_03580 [Pseudomonas saxonica]
MNKQSAVSTIANEAVNQLEVALSYMAWIDSLSYAINRLLKEGHGQHAEQLAGVIQYLSCDYHDMLDSDVKNLNEELNTLDMRS